MSYFVKNVTENDVVAIEKRLIQTNDMIIHKKKRHHFQQVFSLGHVLPHPEG
jgi:hypothetical protein